MQYVLKELQVFNLQVIKKGGKSNAVNTVLQFHDVNYYKQARFCRYIHPSPPPITYHINLSYFSPGKQFSLCAQSQTCIQLPTRQQAKPAKAETTPKKGDSIHATHPFPMYSILQYTYKRLVPQPAP